MSFITLGNDGPRLASTNYWATEYARKGILYLSWNAGAARLLVPPPQEHAIPEMRTGKHVIVSRGPMTDHAGRQGLEILFDDGTDDPYAVFMASEQCDRMLPPSDVGREYPFHIYTRHGLVGTMEGHYRVVHRIPCLKPLAEEAKPKPRHRTFQHLTLDTGHVRRSPRSEISDATVATVGKMVAEALDGQPSPLVDGLMLQAKAVDGALHAVILAGDDPLVTFSVAATREAGEKAWRNLPRERKRGVRQPEAPWCAVILQLGVLRHPEHVPMLGDIERCVTWAWIEGAAKGKT